MLVGVVPFLDKIMCSIWCRKFEKWQYMYLGTLFVMFFKAQIPLGFWCLILNSNSVRCCPKREKDQSNNANIRGCSMLDWARVRSNTQHLKKRDPNGWKTKMFGFPTIRANIHTCFLPITNVYKTSLSIFNITLKLITCSMLPLFTVP